MKLTEQIANNLRTVHFGGNWTGANLKEKLDGVTWKQATTPVGSLHSIATLVFHMNYYISATIKALHGEPLEAQDEYSFDCPAIASEDDWNRLVEKTWLEVEELASLIENMPDEKMAEYFVEEKNGTYYRCLQGIVEHCHYHSGQVAVVKTLLQSGVGAGTESN